LIVGLLVALALKADAIQLLKSDQPRKTLGWEWVFADPKIASHLLAKRDSKEKDTPNKNSPNQEDLLRAGMAADSLTEATIRYFLALHNLNEPSDKPNQEDSMRAAKVAKSLAKATTSEYSLSLGSLKQSGDKPKGCKIIIVTLLLCFFVSGFMFIVYHAENPEEQKTINDNNNDSKENRTKNEHRQRKKRRFSIAEFVAAIKSLPRETRSQAKRKTSRNRASIPKYGPNSRSAKRDCFIVCLVTALLSYTIAYFMPSPYFGLAAQTSVLL
jgi:hypothetical protein